MMATKPSAATTPAIGTNDHIQSIPKVTKTILTFKSDLRKSQFASSARPCGGILHVTRTTTSTVLLTSPREDHAYAWISNYGTIEHAMSHLANYGFERNTSEFIPYSSKSNWVNKYPHAFPYVNCDNYGHVTGFPFWSPYAANALDIPPEIVHVAMQPSTAAAMLKTKRNGSSGVGGVKRDNITMDMSSSGVVGGSSNTNINQSMKIPGGILTHTERIQLHKEIYNYFVWLSDQVDEMETTDIGRRSVKKVCSHALEVRAIVNKLESAFKFIGLSNSGGTGRPSSSLQQQQQRKMDNTSSRSTTPPLLEELLVHEMASLAAAEDENKKRSRSKVKADNGNAAASSAKRMRTTEVGEEEGTSNTVNGPSINWDSLDFDIMFDKLVAYMDEHGSANVPIDFAPPDAQLSSWVSELRRMKKSFDEVGPTKDDDATMPTEAGTTTTTGDLQYLTTERIQRLESIGFDWSIVSSQPTSSSTSNKQTKSRTWEERLTELKDWRDTHGGTFNVPRTCSLGEWLHSQRQLYSKRDDKFMANKAPRMEAIGYVFDLRENNSVSWDDRFQQLVEFHEKHGTFDVPPPASGGDNLNEEMDEKYKFYKWVCRLHNEYRAFEKGTSSKLNAERIGKLNDIGFVFKGPKNRGRPSNVETNPVPKLAWEKRIQQLKLFKADTGHLNIDHNYKHCSNLGGWAAEISQLHQNWKAGLEVLSEETITNFDTLQKLGFEFKVLPYYERNRSWEDHFASLLKFKEENNGSVRVPLKYKADLRLGKWVQTQRQQYKLWKEGKKSSLNEERIEKLESAGFEWVVASGPGKDEEEDEVLDNM